MWFDLVIQFVFIYLVTWWLVLFVMLPVGIRRNDSPEAGHDHGAPQNPALKKRMLWTSLVTLLLTIAIQLTLQLTPLKELVGA